VGVRATLETELVLAALHLAVGARRVTPGLVHHSDRGVQYASDRYQQRASPNTAWSRVLSSRRDCWDNAPVESFFSNLKAELLPDHPWQTRAAAEAAIADHMAFYNRRRLHSALGYRSPIAYEADLGSTVMTNPSYETDPQGPR
jgi:transposase InsO family protein